MSKKRLRKTLGVIFLVGAILATQIPSESVADKKLSTNDDFQLDGDTLVKYTGTADTVSVPSAVKVIGQEAFAGNDSIVEISFPSGLEKISYAAFSDCIRLKKVNIPDSCEEISTAAFTNCSSLSRVTIGKGIRSLGNGIFVGCKKLKELSINTPTFLVVDSVIYNKDKSKLVEVLPSRNKDKLDIPATVTNIYPYSFYGCDSLQKVNLPSKMQEIPAYSFSGCSGLKSITIPYSVNNIDSKAFENCTNLKETVIPESVSFIHDTAFDGCFNLEIDAPVNSYAYKWYQNFDRSSIAHIDNEDNNSDADNSSSSSDKEKTESPHEETVTSNNVVVDGLSQTKVVGRHAVIFIDNTVPTVKGPSSLTENDNVQETNNENNNFGEDSSLDNDASVDNLIEDNSDYSDIIQDIVETKGLNLPKFAIIEDKISNKAFYNDLSLKEYEIPEGIKSIGDFSFARSGLESIVIDNGVEKIGYGAFYHCDKLASVDIPSSVKEIEASAFDKTPWFDNWLESGNGDFLIVGDGVLIGYKGSGSVVHIPDNVKVIAAESFMNHKGITEVYLPDSLECIKEGAFKGCVNLKYVSKGAYVSSIEDRAFDGCPIETVRIVDSVKSIGIGAYDYTTALIDDSKKVIYFHGDILPSISYCKTSTRLNNYNYRKYVFSGLNVAIINNADIDLKNTVLDPKLPGFRGLICTIDSVADSNTIGSLNIVACTLSSEEVQYVNIPNQLEIYGKLYEFNQVSLEDYLNQARAGAFDQIIDNSNSLTINGSERNYSLKVEKQSIIDKDIINAYSRIYGDSIPESFVEYDVSLWENENRVLLSKFGSRKLEINFDLPANIPTKNLHLICLDEDNQLEDIPYVTESSENSDIIVVANIEHTGKYALYNADNGQQSAFNLDDTPNTGDFIHPKWFLSLGLLSASLAMFLIKRK